MKHLIQTLRIGMALFLAVFGTSAIPTATAFALEDDVVVTEQQTDQTVQTAPPAAEQTTPTVVEPTTVTVGSEPLATPPTAELFVEESTPPPLVQDPEVITEENTPQAARSIIMNEVVSLDQPTEIDQTCDDVTTPGSNGWTIKYAGAEVDTIPYTAPAGFLVDQYCVKAGSTQQGNGPVIIPIVPPSSSVTINYPGKDSISHYVVHLIAAPQVLVNPALPSVRDICGTVNDAILLPQSTSQITYGLNGNVVTATLVNPTTHDFGTTLNGYVVADNGLTATYTVTYQFTNTSCEEEEDFPCPANTEAFDANDNGVIEEDECFKKVFVCKYVGTPGIDERLQTGNNPISVSVNSIAGPVVVGAYFNDAQGRSFVLAFDEGQQEPSVDDCPGVEEPTVEVLDTVCIAEGQTGTFTIRVTNTNDYAVEYRVDAEGSDSAAMIVDGNSSADFTFSGYAAGTYSYEVYQKVAHDMEDELSFLSTRIASQPVYTYELVASGDVTLQNCPRVLGETDVCPNITGTQATVPQGYSVVNGQCVVPQVAQISQTPQVLAANTLPATLPATGASDSSSIYLILGMAFSALTYFAMLRRDQEAYPSI